MKIGIDARFYGPLGKGLGRYVSELIAQLEKIDSTNDYVIFLRKENWNQYNPTNPRFKKILAEYQWYSWREQLFFPFFLKKFKLDLMHFTHFNVPLLYQGPFIVTVHDLILLQHPTVRATTLNPLFYKLKYLAYKLVIRNALKKSRAIITVSKTARKEIQKQFSFTEKKEVSVTYGACSKKTDIKNSQNNKLQTKYKQPFIIYVGSAYPHKNLEILIESFSLFRNSGFQNWHLILVGKEDYFYDRLKKHASEKQIEANVIFAGYVDDSELAKLYKEASFYIFPSLCEGFGLPPIEAMNNELPVASSNYSCLPEVLGDAVIYFDPTNKTSMMEAMQTLASNNEIRNKLIIAGKEWIKRFDWNTVAEKTLELYKKYSSKIDENTYEKRN